jgi:OmpA-OmpF porin, OOP family
MKMQIKGKLLGLAAIAAIGMAATSAAAQSKTVTISFTTDDRGVSPYVLDSRQVVATSGAGLCWRTGFWSPAAVQTAYAGSFPAGCVCDKDLVPADMCAAPDWSKTK